MERVRKGKGKVLRDEKMVKLENEEKIMKEK